MEIHSPLPQTNAHTRTHSTLSMRVRGDNSIGFALLSKITIQTCQILLLLLLLLLFLHLTHPSHHHTLHSHHHSSFDHYIDDDYYCYYYYHENDALLQAMHPPSQYHSQSYRYNASSYFLREIRE